MQTGWNIACGCHTSLHATVRTMTHNENKPAVLTEKKAWNVTLTLPLPHFTCLCCYQPQRWDDLEWNFFIATVHWGENTHHLIGYCMSNHSPLEVFFFSFFNFHFLMRFLTDNFDDIPWSSLLMGRQRFTFWIKHNPTLKEFSPCFCALLELQ